MKFRDINGREIEFRTEASNQSPVMDKKIQAMRQSLKEFFVGAPSLTSGDSALVGKDTGSLGSFNHIGNDELQSAYGKPTGQLPMGIGQNNPTTGEPHFNGEMWNSNNNDIDWDDVREMETILRVRGS